MKRLLLTVFTLLVAITGSRAEGGAYAPAPGSPDRQAIMDLMRLDFYRGNAAAAHRNSNKVVFKVVFLRVHGDWACTCVERINADGKPITEPAWALLRRKANQWTDTNYFDALRPFSSEEAAQDALDMSPETIRRVRKRFPNAPADIFPKPNEWHY